MDDVFDVVAVGDVMIDAFLIIQEASKHCRLNESKKEICVDYGGKIVVDRCEFSLGGNACNVAVGLSRLGLKVGLFAEIGDDEFAQKIVNGLANDHVDQRLLIKTPHAASSFAVGINFKDERTLFVDHVEREHNFDYSKAKTRWVYLTSLGKKWTQTYQKALAYIKDNNFKLAFSPGSYQLSGDLEEVYQVLKTTEILFINKEEAKKITSLDKDDIRELFLALEKMGAKTTVITDGRDGVFAMDKDKKIYYLEIYPVEVIERTGAGDAFATAFLAAEILNKDIKEAIRWGTLNSAAVIQKVGAQKGLMAKDKLIEKLTTLPNFLPKEI